MGFNKKNFKMIREKYATKYRLAQDMADERRREVDAAVPEIAAIDARLTAMGPNYFALALSGDAKALQRFEDDMKAMQEKRAALLASHGYPADYTLPHYSCEACGDTGYVNCVMCSCMKRDLILAGYASSGLGNLLREQSFDNFDLDFYQKDAAAYAAMQSNVNVLRRFAETFDMDRRPDSFLLIGGTGLGKTHLSTAVARCVLEKGYDVRYVTAINMLSDFETKQFRNGTTEGEDPTVDYFECDLLILDDLGTEMSNQFTVSCIYNVIDTRLNLERPTIINTNLNQNDLRTRYWDRVTSRLFGAYRPLLFRGTDVRIQKISR